MALFDPNSLNNQFDSMFGAGSYNAGIQAAANAAKLKTQAGFAKQNYLKALTVKQNALNNPKKTYNDALAYWNDPTNKSQLKQQGAYKAAQDLLNDPNKQQEIKDAGYSVQDFVDAMYNAASDGQFKSQRAYNQYAGDLAKSNAPNVKQNQQEIQDVIDQDKLKADAAKQAKVDLQNEKNSWLGKLHLTPHTYQTNPVYTGLDNFFTTLATAGERFDNQLMGTLLPKANEKANQQQAQLIQKKLAQNPNDPVMKINAKMYNDSHKQATTVPEKLTNLAGGLAGNTLPYMVGDGLLSVAGKGLQAVNNPLVRTALHGAASGLVGSGLDVAAKQAISHENLTPKQMATEIGLNTAGGAVFAPALEKLSQFIIGKVTTPKASTNTLGLPAPQQNMALPAPNERLGLPEPQKLLPKPTSPLMQMAKSTKGTARPMADFSNASPTVEPYVNVYGVEAPKGSLVDTAPPEYWQKRYNDFVQFVHDSGYNENNLNHDAIQELWTHFAKPDEPALNAVVDLAYNGYQAPKQLNAADVWDKMGNRPPVSNKAKNLLGLDLQQGLNNFRQAEQGPLSVNATQLPANPNETNMIQPLQVTKQPFKPLKMPTFLSSIKVNKTVDSMTQPELQSVYQQLEKKLNLLSNGKGNKAQIQAVQDDMKRVNNFLQFFAEKKPQAGENIAPAPAKPITEPTLEDGHNIPLIDKKAAAKRILSFKANAQKAGLPKHLINEVLKTPNIVQVLNGAKSFREVANRLPKDLGDQLLSTLKNVKELQNTKDILPHQSVTMNAYEILDRLPKELGDPLKTAFDTGKMNHVNNLEQRSNSVEKDIVKKFGYEKGSKESALIQDFGEKTLGKQALRKQGIDPSKVSKEVLDTANLQQLQKLRPKDWRNIVKSDKYFHEQYQNIIKEVNATIEKIYPGNKGKKVPERQDYYHHFNELDGFEGFKNLLESSAAIDPHLAGVSPHTKPNSKWQGFKQQRKNGAYKSDAIGGFLKYLQASSYSTHIDPIIKLLRQTAEQVASGTEKTKNLNWLKSALELQADSLAGKTNPTDRFLQEHVLGRKAMQVLNLVNSHVKKNMILGNMGSALGQIGNVPLTIGKAKQYAPQGFLDTLSYAANHLMGEENNLSSPISKSQFLKERFSGKYFTRFDTGLLKNAEKMAAWLLETADKSGTYFTWNSMYRKGLAEKVADPIKFADTQTRHIVAGRGIGEVPVLQKSKVMQLVAPFTLEVGNQWKVLGKQMSQKDFAGVITFLVASGVLNAGMNKVKGNDISFNPIGAVMDGYNKTDGNTMAKLKGAGANLLGETVGNIPGGAYIPQILGVTSPATKKALFGDRSPDRFGTGVGVASTVFKPSTDALSGKWSQALKDTLPLAVPFGGNQLKKSFNGIEAMAKGGSYNSKSQLQYPVNASNPSDFLHSLLLGPTTTANGQDYYNNNRKALSDKQTLEYQNAQDKQQYYDNLQIQRQVNSIKKKMSDTKKDSTLSPQEKQQKLMELYQQILKLQK